VKKLFFITTMALSSFLLKAQHVEFGVKGGLNVATVKVKNSTSSYDPRVSAHVGGLAHIHLTKEFAIQPELVFSGQGFKSGGGDNNGDVTRKFNYLNVPVLVQYMFNNGIRLETGPQVGFLLSAKENDGSGNVDIKPAFKDVDFAWAAGAGYLMPSGLGFDARVNLGIAKINENNTIADRRNGVFQVGLFYQFRPASHK
jgi:hypothetical protein